MKKLVAVRGLIWNSIKPVVTIILLFWGIGHLFPTWPIYDRGHRVFLVENEKTACDLLEVLKIGGLTVAKTFEYGETKQVLLSDGMTVLMLIPEDKRFGTGNGVSLLSNNPQRDADRAYRALKERGYMPQVRSLMGPSVDPKKLIVVAAKGLPFEIVFRRAALAMGGPPKEVPLTCAP